MPKKKTCTHKKVHGGKFEWRCVLELNHEEPSHFMKAFPIAEKTST